MDKPEHIVVLVTASDAGEAQRIASALLEKRQAACVNIVPKVASHFWWEGKLDTAAESLLIIKSRAARLEDIIRLVKEVHSNTVPEIIALPIIGGSPDYLEWLDKEVA
jgi:periplasmic divalent cation tolerance protein